MLRSFAIFGKENKRGLTLEENTIVDVLVYRRHGRGGGGYHRMQMMVPRLELLMPETNF